MDVGIGLPNAVRGVDRRGIVDWARRGEQAGFSSLGTIDRVVYPNYESLISLAAAAAVTERIRARDRHPHRAAAHQHGAARQAGGDARPPVRGPAGARPGVGGREDDYAASGVDFERAGASSTASCPSSATLAGKGGVGPRPRRRAARLLIGGGPDIALRRAAEHGDGWTMGGGTPDMFAESLGKLNEAWSSAGRDG